jgi:DNA-binding NarL/FixJ family response regulator
VKWAQQAFLPISAFFAERALRAGAQGYVMKKAPKEELLAAIRDIVQGRIYVSRDVAMRAFKKSLKRGRNTVHLAQPALCKTYRTAKCTFSTCLAPA